MPSTIRPAPGKPTALPLNVSYRVSRIADLIKGRWLDLGCADGGYTAELLRQGAVEVIGVDSAEERIARATARGLPDASFQVALGESLPFPDAHFDGVFMNEVFEHVTDEKATLHEVARVLAPGGTLALISPNRWFPFEGHGMQSSFFNTESPVPLLPWLPQSLANRWMVARNYWPRQLVEQVEKAGLVVASREFIWPVLEFYPWLPKYFRETYQAHIKFFDSMPGLRRFGVSTLVVGRRAGDSSQTSQQGRASQLRCHLQPAERSIFVAFCNRLQHARPPGIAGGTAIRHRIRLDTPPPRGTRDSGNPHANPVMYTANILHTPGLIARRRERTPGEVSSRHRYLRSRLGAPLPTHFARLERDP